MTAPPVRAGEGKSGEGFTGGWVLSTHIGWLRMPDKTDRQFMIAKGVR